MEFMWAKKKACQSFFYFQATLSEKKTLLDDEVAPTRITLNTKLGHFDLEVRECESDRITAQGLQGSKASYTSNMSPYGTIGWNIFFSTQNIWVFLSNYHVLVDPANPRTGINIFTGEGAQEAVLHAMVGLSRCAADSNQC